MRSLKKNMAMRIPDCEQLSTPILIKIKTTKISKQENN